MHHGSVFPRSRQSTDGGCAGAGPFCKFKPALSSRVGLAYGVLKYGLLSSSIKSTPARSTLLNCGRAVA
eukprot:932738-Lingulodinium_polyedra.AAC.1